MSALDRELVFARLDAMRETLMAKTSASSMSADVKKASENLREKITSWADKAAECETARILVEHLEAENARLTNIIRSSISLHERAEKAEAELSNLKHALYDHMPIKHQVKQNGKWYDITVDQYEGFLLFGTSEIRALVVQPVKVTK